MDLALNPAIDVSEAATITLAGRSYLIPRLMFRQTVKIGPLFPVALRLLNRRAAAVKAIPVDEEGNPRPFKDGEDIEFMAKLAMTEDEADAALKIIAAGLSRAYPKARVEDLYDLPLTPTEIYGALSTVIMQTAATEPVKGDNPGEA